MLGIIRVLTTDDQDVLQEHGRTMNRMYQIEHDTQCIPDQPNGVYDEASENLAIPKIIQLVEKMSLNKEISVVTISCAGDPGLDEARECVEIPVLGAGECGGHAAAMVGNKIGIIGITEEPPEKMKAALGDKYYSHLYSPQLRRTTDLFSNHAKTELLRMTKKLIDDGADGILFACTGFSTIRLKDYLMNHIDVPIIDLVESQAIAYQLIKGGK